MRPFLTAARDLVLSLLLDPRALAALAMVVALCAGLLLGADPAEARRGVSPGGPLP
jgi:hypothetical protein